LDAILDRLKKSLSGEEAAFSIKILAGIPDSKIIYEPEAILFHKVPRRCTTIKYLFS
jgi:hypothetical protein